MKALLQIRTLIFLAVILALIGSNRQAHAQNAWNGTADTDWYTSNSSATSFDISSAEELAGLAQLVRGGNNFSGKTINLTADIYLNEDDYTVADAQNWIPIGLCTSSEGGCTYETGASSNTRFCGTFNGNYYSIYNMYLSRNYAAQGLFGTIGNGALLTKFFLVNPVITAYGMSGCVAGTTFGTTNVRKVMVIDAQMTFAQCNNVGMFIGATYPGTLVNFENCAAIGTLASAYAYFGGFCGNGERSTYKNCYTHWTTPGTPPVPHGGMTAHSGTATNSYSTTTTGTGASFTNKTLQEMQDVSFLALLGEAWIADDDNVNNGLPVLNTCDAPSNISITTATSTAMSFSWAGNAGNYYVEYGERGFTPGTNDAIDNDYISTTTYATQIDLTPATPYTLAIKSDCGSGSTSGWTIFDFGTPVEDETYGDGIWHGYVYSSPTACTFNEYLGMVTENETFNRNPLSTAAWTGETTAWSGTAPVSNFSVRYRMTKTFPCGNYTFTIGSYDYARLSIDGGVTWLIPGNWGGSAGTTTYTNSVPVFFDGTTATDLVFEYSEGTGTKQARFAFSAALVSVTASNYTPWSVDLAFGGTEPVNLVISTAVETDPANPENAVHEQNSLTTNPYTVTNLVPETTYYIYVQTDCGGPWNSTTIVMPPTCPVPTNIAYNAATGILTWDALGMTDWNIKVSTTELTNPGIEFGDVTDDGTATGTPEFTPTCLLAGNSYHFYVQADCGDGDFSGWGHYALTMGYCRPSSTSGPDGDGIVNVTFGTVQVINNTTGREANGYLDASQLVGIVLVTDTFPVTVTQSVASYSYPTRIWIDWNCDFVFDESTEKVAEYTNTSANRTITSLIAVPENTPPGKYRMRVRGNYSSFTGPCNTTTWSSAEDYTLLVLPEGTTCFPPSNIASSDITHESATISWTASSSLPSDGYDVYYSNDCVAPDENTSAMETFTTVTGDLFGLSSLTTYYVWVRSNCESGYSMWFGPHVLTTLPPCVDPANIEASNVTNTSADFSWEASINASSFEIEVGPRGFLPGDASVVHTGTSSTTTYSIPTDVLTDATAYTFAVRSICGTDGESVWSLFDFGTTADETFGDGIWHGYVYKSPTPDVPASRFGTYLGMVTEPVTFDRNPAAAAWTGNNPVWVGTAPTDYFAVRYKMTYDFPCGNYTFTFTGIDDAVRFSIDGGQTWLSLCNGSNCAPSYGWNTTNYINGLYKGTAYMEGPANLVIEFFEATGNARCSFDYTVTPIGITTSNLTPNSVDVNFAAGEEWNLIVSTSPQTDLENPTDVVTNVSDVTSNPYPLSGLMADSTYYIYAQLTCGGPWGNTSVTTVSACPQPTGLTAIGIGADTATLQWNAFGMNGWNLKVSTTSLTDPDTETADVFDAPVSTSTYQLTSQLTPMTTYYCYVQSDCGSLWSTEFVFTTTQIPAVLPYTCGFEDVDENVNWTILNGNQTNKWHIGSAVNNGGANSLYISNDNGTSCAYTNTSAASFVYAYRDFAVSSDGIYSISFDWKCNGESAYDLLRAFLVPLTVELEAGNNSGMSGATNTTPSGWTDLTNGKLNLSTSWNSLSNDNVALTSGVHRLLFFWKNDGSGGANPPASVDNVDIRENTCPIVTNLTVPTANITINSADVTWTAGGAETEWGVKYCEAGDDPDLVTEDVVSAMNYQISNLSSETTYYVYVRARCDGDDDVSRWKIISFTTLISCPQVTNIQTDNLTPFTTDITWTAGGTETEWGVKYCVTGDDPDLVTEAVVTTNSYSITGLSSETTYDVYVRARCDGSNDASSWKQFSFTTLISCPQVTNMNTTATTSSSADLTWTAGGAETQWSVKVVPFNNDHTSYTATTVATTAYSATALSDGTPLNSNTRYDLWVQANCDASDNSAWRKYTFRTACGSGNIADMGYTEGAGNIPWVDNFTYTSAQLILDLPECWTKVHASVANNNMAVYVHTTTQSLDFGGGPISSGFRAAVMPKLPDEVNVNQLKMKFDYKKNASGTYVKICMTDTPSSIDISDYEVVGQATALSTGFEENLISFENYTGTARYIAFVVEDGGGLVDNLKIWLDTTAIVTPCVAPTNVTVNEITQNSAKVNWNPSSTAVSYTVEYRKGTDDYTAIAGVTNTSAPLSNLIPATQYDVRVKSICSNGESSYANATPFTTLAHSDCTVPTALASTVLNATAATLTWNAGASETQWMIAWKVSTASSWNTQSATATTFTLNTLVAQTCYDVRVRAVCSPGDSSEWTAVHNFCTPETTCDKPTNLTISEIASNSISISWTPGDAETEWKIEWKATGGAVNSGNATGTPEYTITDLTPLTAYNICVQAVCATDILSEKLCADATTTSINEIVLDDAVKIYPNPTSTVLQITIENMQLAGEDIVIMDMTGRIVEIRDGASIQNGRTTINVSGWSSGIYLVKVGSYVGKFVKQ